MAKSRGASCLTRSLKLLDFVLILAGGAIVAVIFYIEHAPSLSAGWLFFALGVLVFLAGLTGLPTKNTGRQSCFGCHTLALLLSGVLTGGVGALMLLKKEYVVKRLHPASLSLSEVNQVVEYETYGLLGVAGICFLCLIVSCSVMRVLIPAKQKFWHDDYTYRQRALSYYEMKEEADTDAEKRTHRNVADHMRAKYSKHDPDKPELLREYKEDRAERQDIPAGPDSPEDRL